ncbi:MAG TPA: host attachment protein [Nannocystis sp.]
MTLRNEGHPLADVLVRLAAEYRHFQQEHEREPAERPTRRVLAGKMRKLGEQFTQLVERWIDDEELRARWTAHLLTGGDPPDEPHFEPPPLFAGITEAGSRVEIRVADDGGYDLLVDGRIERHETTRWHLDPDMIEPLRIGEYTCREVFDAPEEAIEALREFVATPGAEPPWKFARELFADGLIDLNFGLMPRGRRAIGRGEARLSEGPAYLSFGVLAVDGARSRVFVLRTDDGEQVPTVSPLVEVAQTTNPDRRAKDSELFTDARPGLRREGPQIPQHGTSDRRDGHRRDAERRFAAEAVAEAARVFREQGVTRVVVVANPAMLGTLRPAMKDLANVPWTVREIARDLSRLSPPALHDALAEDGALPPRGRMPSTRSQPGVPLQ